MLVIPCVWRVGGGWKGPHGTRGKPYREGCVVSWVVAGATWVLCLSSPDAWASLPTWCPEGAWAHPPGSSCGRTVSRESMVRVGVREGYTSHSPRTV